MDYKPNVIQLSHKVKEFLQCVKNIGNECAYTDSLLEEILSSADSLKRAYNQDNKLVYLLNVTFYAGSDSEEDTDNDTILIYTDKKISYTEMVATFNKVNDLLNFKYDEDSETDENFPISYEDGLNLGVLIDGVEIYTEYTIKYLKDYEGFMPLIENYYNITQWQ